MFCALDLSAQTNVLHLKSDVVDTMFGTPVADPYRWMESMNSDSIKQWLLEQEKLTSAVQQNFNGRMWHTAENMEVNSPFQYTSAKKTGKWYFEMMNSSNPFNPSPILYYRENDNDRWETAYNPNDVEAHKAYNIHDWSLSDSGGLVAVSLSLEGSDWQEIRVHNLKKLKDLKDRITHVRFSDIVWWHDGFFYASYKNDGPSAMLGGQELHYHKLGTTQDEDVLLLSTPTEAAYSHFSFSKTSNNRYLVVERNRKIGLTGYSVIEYKDLDNGLDDEWKDVVRLPFTNKADFSLIDYADSGFIFKTNYKAPFGRVLSARLGEVNHLAEILIEQDEMLKEVTYVHNELVALYFTKGAYDVCMFNTEGKIIHRIKFDPGIEVTGFEGQPGDSETIFYENMFYLPRMVNRYDFKTKKVSLVDKTKIIYDGTKYNTDVITYHSKDGTEIPMYITYKKGLKLKGNNPVILYGYGGFGISVTPSYDPANILLFENNGILAVPMIRGGGELGEAWHEGGSRLNKQNSFDDFAAAAEYLKKEGYTSKEKLAIEGGSNGGLLVASVMLQHPDLCQVVIAHVGVYDMIRFPMFTGGKYWLNEYGHPDKQIDFKNLLSYSPYHNVKDGIAYPATLFITGKNDDRVVPFHTYKLLATMQEHSAGSAPHILYFEQHAGHNGSTNIPDLIKEESFILAFIFSEMHLPLK